jgi:integrase
MPSNLSDRRVSPLRARMIEDMTVRGFTEKTRQDYVRHVHAFAAFIGRSPATATPDDIRGFQLHQRQSGMQPPSINTAVSALRFLFTVTLDRPDLARRLTVVRQPRRLPSVLSVEEVALLLQAAPGLKYKAAFATAYGAGLRVSEVVALKVGDIDSERMLLRVEQGKGRKIATPCCRRACSNGCANGGARGDGSVRCSREAGCFPAAIRSNRYRPASSTAPFSRRRHRRDQKRCRRIPCGTASPPPAEQDTDIHHQVLLGHASSIPRPVTPVLPTPRSAVTSPLDRLGRRRRRPSKCPAGGRAPPEVGDRRHLPPSWRRRRKANAGHVSLGQLQVMSAIENCRSAVLGGHVERCQDCGHRRIAYNSCRNRHCPKCQGAAARDWLAAQEADLLPVGYFHLVFTCLPRSLHAYQNKAVSTTCCSAPRRRPAHHRRRSQAPRRPH